MASMRDIKRRKGSIQSTQQITKAMKLVSTVKLQKAKTRAEQSKTYFDYMYATVTSMLARSGNINHPYLVAGESKKKAVIVITSNRGLAGGYNVNVTKLLTNSDIAKEDAYIYAIGRKGKDFLARRGYEIKADYSEVINEPIYKDAAEISREVLDLFAKGEIGEIYLAYTAFKNTVTHIPTMIKLLPVDIKEDKDTTTADKLTLMNYEPHEEEALNLIIPKYITSLIYGALVEAVASENGARMQAMDSATSNAQDLISDLSLKYNRARQGSITQELTEIIAGANAIS
ncbi:ATP synthase F1 subunit gamma [Candidatus Galacturonibacter soehngenii]|uniref:ATP synthase gamma chain n=1 Tax=Candidatus Galacturonatibacter soehngenii TaxID=2307010 RepID=A0A7V7QL07_9FIRM|nr:ATP synthase F1 subunit gamma [Candidatus Galacturonibacter soehngenii]KAB1438584.1 ATP synthase F1 subunit gamma [Candidatus Galacturonibacter soehngenii]MBA4685615.1 ATP synthase F1 subunit gamma [Candidatus Galacturonibacter soehngenii]